MTERHDHPPPDKYAPLLALRSFVAWRLYPASKVGGNAALGPFPNKPPKNEWRPSGVERLDIDRAVERLRKKGLLRAHDAHVAARFWTALAVDRACRDAIVRAVAEKGLAAALERSEDAAHKLEQQISVFLDSDHNWNVALGAGYRSSRMDYLKHNEAAHATHKALDSIAAARVAANTLTTLASAARNRLVPAHAAGDVWRQGFVAVLCFGWKDLTGETPKPDSGLFRAFVADCYSSLTGNAHTVSWMERTDDAVISDDENDLPEFDSWTSVVRTVVRDILLRPDWDGIERYELLLDPPGAKTLRSSETPSATNKRLTKLRERQLAELSAESGAVELINEVVVEGDRHRQRQRGFAEQFVSTIRAKGINTDDPAAVAGWLKGRAPRAVVDGLVRDIVRASHLHTENARSSKGGGFQRGFHGHGISDKKSKPS